MYPETAGKRKWGWVFALETPFADALHLGGNECQRFCSPCSSPFSYHLTRPCTICYCGRCSQQARGRQAIGAQGRAPLPRCQRSRRPTTMRARSRSVICLGRTMRDASRYDLTGSRMPAISAHNTQQTMPPCHTPSGAHHTPRAGGDVEDKAAHQGPGRGQGQWHEHDQPGAAAQGSGALSSPTASSSCC